MSLAGTLYLYRLPATGSVGAMATSRLPCFTSADETADRAVVFIGGLTTGLMDPPYVVRLSDTLKEAKWSMVQMMWSGSHNGWGRGSLDRDVREMESLIKSSQISRQGGVGVKTVIIMGNSTGSQDVMHYLTSPYSPSSNLRTKVQGGILQAPASDREGYEKGLYPFPKLWAEQIPIAKQWVEQGKGEMVLDEAFGDKIGSSMSAYRLLSLITVGGDDDYFSKDVPDSNDENTTNLSARHAHPLSTSFGRLDVPALVLWSEKDEYSSREWPETQTLLNRWEKAAETSGMLDVKVVKDASHGVEDALAQERLCEEVVAWLGNHFP